MSKIKSIIVFLCAIPLLGVCQTDSYGQATINYLEGRFPGSTIETLLISAVSKTTPKEISSLEALEDAGIRLAAATTLDQNTKDSLLAENDSIHTLLENYIVQNNIQAVYGLTHIFEVIDSLGGIRIIEAEFNLNEAKEVVDVHLIMNTVLTTEENEWLAHFLAREPIYMYRDSYQQDQDNKKLYDYLFGELEKDNDDKDELLHSILAFVKHVRTNRGLDAEKLAAEVVSGYITRAYDGNYVPGEFSNFATVSDGYTISHTFSIDTSANPNGNAQPDAHTYNNVVFHLNSSYMVTNVTSQ